MTPCFFSTNIAENLRQERYLPFEGAGAISSWHLELPRANTEIEIDTVTDVVLHVRDAALHDDNLAHAVEVA
jgi:Tc toxin complex TcA C-terminal TcB-binding domain